MQAKSFTTILSLLVAVVLITVPVPGQPPPLNGFAEYAEKAMRDWEVPGMAISIVKDDKIVFSKGFGVRKLGEATPVDDRTLFAIGSSSKAVTAAALAILVDEGKMKWDDPVTKYLPEFETYEPYVTRELTIRDLLTHRSGLDRGEFVWYGMDNSREEVLRRTKFLKPSWSLRSTFAYQNLMYIAAGQVIARVTGQSWDDFVANRFFTPLGMTASNTTIRALKGNNNLAMPHAKFDSKLQAIPWRNIDNAAAAGSINSNVADMAQWVRLQLGGGTFQGQKIFSAAVAKEMHTPQMVMRLEGFWGPAYPEAHFLNYGLGWFLSDYKGRKLADHGGSIDGMRALVALVPEEKLGVVILTSMNQSNLPIPLLYRIIDSYIGAPQKDWSAEFLKTIRAMEEQGAAAQKKAEAARAQGTKPSLDLSNYASTYSNELYGDVRITISNGRLKMQFGPSFGGELEHWHYDTFRASFFTAGSTKTMVTFILNAQGKIDTLVMDLPGLSDYPFKRVPDAAKTPAAANNNQ